MFHVLHVHRHVLPVIDPLMRDQEEEHESQGFCVAKVFIDFGFSFHTQNQVARPWSMAMSS